VQGIADLKMATPGELTCLDKKIIIRVNANRHSLAQLTQLYGLMSGVMSDDEEVNSFKKSLMLEIYYRLTGVKPEADKKTDLRAPAVQAPILVIEKDDKGAIRLTPESRAAIGVLFAPVKK